MDEGSTLAVGREIAGRRIFKTFNDGLYMRQQQAPPKSQYIPYSLSRSIVSDDKGEGGMELDRFATSIVEGADAGILVSRKPIKAIHVEEKLSTLTQESRVCRFSLGTKLLASQRKDEGRLHSHLGVISCQFGRVPENKNTHIVIDLARILLGCFQIGAIDVCLDLEL